MSTIDRPALAMTASISSTDSTYIEEESMSKKELRRELQRLGVFHQSMFEKYELVAALKKAREARNTSEEQAFIDTDDDWTFEFDPWFDTEFEFVRAT